MVATLFIVNWLQEFTISKICSPIQRLDLVFWDAYAIVFSLSVYDFQVSWMTYKTTNQPMHPRALAWVALCKWYHVQKD